MKKTIVVAMSGGIDSTIASWLLKNQGYEVIGVYFQFWKMHMASDQYNSEKEKILRLAKQIGIRLEIIDAKLIFKDVVVNEMIEILRQGLTPNPCIRCNPRIKFKLLMDFLEKNQLKYIATGHYANLKTSEDGTKRIFKSRDFIKDQTYFLCLLDQKTLKYTKFPLGDTIKSDNRKLVKSLGLDISEKTESQDLCFIVNQKYADFLKKEVPDLIKPGDIVNTKGEIIGQHNGLSNYTIGQRKGIKISAHDPFYVLAKDYASNWLIVDFKRNLRFNQMIVSDINWISGKSIDRIDCDVKIRYGSPYYSCFIEKMDEKEYRVKLIKDVRDITPGQYAVFYRGDEMLGGGMIKSGSD